MASTEQTEAEISQSSRKQETDRIISKYTGWAAGSGAIPFPLWDIAAIAAVETKMIGELLTIYDKPFAEAKARSIITVLIGSLSPQLLVGVTASTLFKFVPIVGPALATVSMPVLAAASSYAVGHVMVNHFENGGDLFNFDAKAAKDAFKTAFAEGKKKNARSAT